MTLTLGVQWFGISFKLMLITCVGISLQGRNTLTCHRRCHLGESDSVGLPIVWQFIDYMASRATFIVVATYPFAGERGGAHGCVSHERNTRGVATNVYLWKTSEKLKETGHEEYSRFGSYLYV